MGTTARFSPTSADRAVVPMIPRCARDKLKANEMNWLIKHFLRGLIIVVPIAVTVYLLYVAFIWVDRLLPVPIPGLGFAILIVAIVAVGWLGTNIVGRKFVQLTELLFTRAPLVRLIYAALKDLLEAFVGDRKRFDQPVSVKLTEGVRTLGFITQDDLGFLAMEGSVAVYLPFAYSMSGSMVIVPASNVERLAIDSASVMALVVSGGVSRSAQHAHQ
jgi:uncharacterized membrane protein